MINSLILNPRFHVRNVRFAALSITSWPARNTRMSPFQGCYRWCVGGSRKWLFLWVEIPTVWTPMLTKSLRVKFFNWREREVLRKRIQPPLPLSPLLLKWELEVRISPKSNPSIMYPGSFKNVYNSTSVVLEPWCQPQASYLGLLVLLVLPYSFAN